MKSKIETISKYYDYKRKSYNEKYNIGYYTHIHTGFYDPRRFPFLYRDEVDLQRLGIKCIKYLLFVGQENLTNYVCDNLRGNFQTILDCGCGHGGTSIYLAQNYGINVVGITVSKEQVLQAKRFVRIAGLQHLVDVRLMNIFECDFVDAEFDGVVDIDSFCQISNFRRLFLVLSRIIGKRGRLVISDNFVDKTANLFKKRFDLYWRSDVSTLQQLLDAAYREGFVIKKIKELTRNQTPFWKLSISYSRLLLDSKKIRNNKREQQRLAGSLAFHEDLLNAFLNGDMHYYSLVLEKRI